MTAAGTNPEINNKGDYRHKQQSKSVVLRGSEGMLPAEGQPHSLSSLKVLKELDHSTDLARSQQGVVSSGGAESERSLLMLLVLALSNIASPTSNSSSLSFQWFW